MLLIVVLVFFAVFTVAVLALMGTGLLGSQRDKQSIARLNAALVSSPMAVGQDEMADISKSELLSAIPWLNAWLVRLDIAPSLRRLLYQADMKKMTAGRLVLISLTCSLVAGYLLYMKTGVGLVSLAAAPAVGAVPFLFVFRKRAKRFAKFEEGLPATLDLMVGAMRAGQSLVSALGVVARESADPIGPEFRVCFDEQNFGLELRTALQNLVTRVPIPDMRMITTAILIQKESGGNLAEVLEKTGYIMRERFRLKRQIRVHTAQGRLTGWILTLLPVILGFLLYLLNPDTVSLLWKRPMGLKLLYGSSGMIVVGGLIIRKIVQIRV
jgi:tight adherence protein B